PSLFRVFVGKRLRATGPERARFDGRRSLREPEFGPRMGETGFCVMQPSEALSASAQVAVTLAGFAGVVVAFRSGSIHEWSKVDKFRLQVLLSNSVLPFVMSIFGMLLATTNLPERVVWRWSSLVAFILIAGTGHILSRSYRTFSRGELAAAGTKRWIFVAGGLAGIVATLLQLYNVIRLQTFWPFFAGIATWLWLATVQFVLLVTASHKQSGQ